MRNAGGYAIWTDPELPTIEKDSFTCVHCNSVVFVAPGTDPTIDNGFCIKCMKHICGPCADHGECVPWERQMEEFEAKVRTRIHRELAVDRMLR